MKSDGTFEKSSHFDPSVNPMAMIDAKWISPLHRGNAETLFEVQKLSCFGNSQGELSSLIINILDCRPPSCFDLCF